MVLLLALSLLCLLNRKWRGRVEGTSVGSGGDKVGVQ
jgi:hypothetical protein